MTSTILTPKSNFSTVFKNLAKRNVSSIIFILVANLLVAVAGISLSIDSNSDYLAEFFTNKNYETCDLTFDIVMLMGILCVFCGFLSLFISPKLFREIYSKRACDFYFSAPVKRGTYFFASYLFGALLNASAFVLPVAIYCIAMKSVNSAVFVFDIKDILTSGICILLSLLSIYTAFIMSAVMSGRKFHYFLLSLICLFSPSVAITGIMSNINSIWGYYSSQNLMGLISPPASVINNIVGYYEHYAASMVTVSVVEIVCMLAAGYLLFKNRKAEVAEVSLTGKVVPYIMLSVFVLSGFMFTDAVSSDLVTVIVGIIFAVIAGLLFSRIFYKNWFTKETAITTGVVCAVCLIFVSLIYLPSYDKYVKYVPEIDQVESVEIIDRYGLSDYDSVGNQLFLVDSYYSDGYDQNGISPLKITTKQGIEDAMALHRKSFDDKVIEDKKKNEQGFFEQFFGYGYYETYDYTITYNLTDGRQVRRTYSVGVSFVKNELEELFRNKEVVLQSIWAYNHSDEVLVMSYEKYDYYDDSYYEDYELTDDTYSYGTSYKKTFTPEQTMEFIDIFADEVVKLEENDFKCALNLMYDSIVSSISFTDYMYEDTIYGVDIYYISPEATAQQREKLKSMTPEEILSLYWEDHLNDDELSELSMAVNFSEVELFEFNTNSIKYLEEQ